MLFCTLVVIVPEEADVSYWIILLEYLYGLSMCHLHVIRSLETYLCDIAKQFAICVMKLYSGEFTAE